MYKMSPPLRSEADREALAEGVASGIIDVIASDHAPHPASKKGAVKEAAFGVAGIETMLFVVLTECVSKGICSLEYAAERMSGSPARILRIGAGSLKEGAPADMLLIDPDAEWECAEPFFRSQSLNSLFIGRRMKGAVTRMFVQGREVGNGF
jgi:dihydroorotase